MKLYFLIIILIFGCTNTNETNEIKIGHNIAEMARKSVLRMAEIGR